MLEDATPIEREILGSFRFQENVAVLHTDIAPDASPTARVGMLERPRPAALQRVRSR